MKNLTDLRMAFLRLSIECDMQGEARLARKLRRLAHKIYDKEVRKERYAKKLLRRL